MNTTKTDKAKLEYGDFQTPIELSNLVCQKLLQLGITPEVVIEPTCGIGSFIEAAANSFHTANKILGIEVNENYVKTLKEKIGNNKKIEIKQDNFFCLDWSSLFGQSDENILVIGNFPWVTNSRQGTIGGVNLPEKNNFQNYNGFDAITGKSNFDISEWMLIKTIEWLHHYDACLGMLCKVSVARKLLSYMRLEQVNLDYCATYRIDAKRYFDANVDACLLVSKFSANSRNYFCDIFRSFEDCKPDRITHYKETLVKNPEVFQALSDLYSVNSGARAEIKWRSGIKHDCSDVMEFCKKGSLFFNGAGEVVELEETYLFPLIKGSDVAQNRTCATNRYILVTQRFVGEATDLIKEKAPKTWSYLETHADYLDARKSKIYRGNPRFSIFGVGSYTFAPWKIAICGLYKKLDFRLIGQVENKPAVFDDTVYFLSFDNEQSAQQAFRLLSSQMATEFYSCLIFWDEKRPIKSSILNSLDLVALSEIS